MTRPVELQPLADGFAFVESLRWRDGTLWFVDMHGGSVHRTTDRGERSRTVETVAVLESPSGLATTTAGRPSVVSMPRRQLLDIGPDGQLTVRADLSERTPWPLNDAIAAPDGTVYVGCLGFDLFGGGAYADGLLLAVDPAGGTRVTAQALAFPNGMAILADGVTLLVAESAARRISAFTMTEEGRLRDRRVWAELPDGHRPDGICLDAEGLVWAALPERHLCVRIAAGGRIPAQLDFGDRMPISCELSADDGNLYVSSASSLRREVALQRRDARIDRVPVPAAAPPVASRQRPGAIGPIPGPAEWRW
jgi:sugar lactone lactonase YvrE